jgi:hypothetical protein
LDIAPTGVGSYLQIREDLLLRACPSSNACVRFCKSANGASYSSLSRLGVMIGFTFVSVSSGEQYSMKA